jgi:hypothetical protein
MRHGTYLGRGWDIAAVAGMVTAGALGAAAMISNMRHRPTLDRLGIAWVVLALLAASAIRFPFPLDRHGGVQAFITDVKPLGWVMTR